jgi:hypothetical protein
MSFLVAQEGLGKDPNLLLVLDDKNFCHGPPLSVGSLKRG